MDYEKKDIIRESKQLYGDINSCITDLVNARIAKDLYNEGRAIFRMEGLMVATMQHLGCVIDFLEEQKECLANNSKTSESEDERIREGLIEALKTSKTVGELKFVIPEPTREKCIAYLEKQKECVADSSKTSADEDERIRKALVEYHKQQFEKNRDQEIGLFHKDALAYLEKQGEQKVSVDDFKAKDWYVSKVDGKIHNIYYSVDKVKPKFKVGDKIIEKDFDECGRGTIIDIKDGKYIFDDGGLICIEEQGLWKLVEQKPVVTHGETYHVDTLGTQQVIAGKMPQKPAECIPDSVKFDEGFKTGREVGFREGVESVKSAEWSEEDEKKYQCIRCILLTDMDKKIGSWKYSEILEWYEKRGIGRYTYSRPSWKPSKEEIDAFENLLKGEFSNKVFPGTTLANLLNTLKKLYYNEAIPSAWKPSEEQMEALKDAVRLFKETHFEKFHYKIESLYEQLKKLK